jgi:guanine nucleotide-binding protein alpha-1 subunit
VNRLEDSFVLWQTLCSLKSLARTQVILFLNKVDLLERKLASGILVRDFVPSFGDRSNDIDTVKKCKWLSPLESNSDQLTVFLFL